MFYAFQILEFKFCNYTIITKLIYSFTGALTHLITHNLSRSITYSFNQPPNHPLTQFRKSCRITKYITCSGTIQEIKDVCIRQERF